MSACHRARSCFIHHLVFVATWGFNYVVNRWITFYVTTVRALSVWNIGCTMRIQNKTPSEVFLELMVFGYLVGALIYVGIAGATHFLPTPVVIFVMHCLSMVSMTVMALFILLRIRGQILATPTISGRNPATDGFQKMVALVALNLCLCQCAGAVHWGHVLFLEDNTFFVTEMILLTMIATVWNSSVNFFIYYSLSSQFRRNFFRLWKRTRGSIRESFDGVI